MKKLSIYIVAAIFAAAFYSCKKDLNALPGQAKVDGNVIVDQKSAEVALNGAYYRFVEGGDDRGTPSVMWAYDHEIMPTWAAGYLEYPYGGGALSDNSLTSQSYEAEYIWDAGYILVNAANGVLKGVEAVPASKIDATRKTQIIAEAKFLRAYGNYRLLSFYGQYYDINSKYGIILRKDFVTSENIMLSRSTVKDCYDFILADVDDAIANAPDVNKAWYASKWAAKALKARILINRGAPGDYAQVVTLTQDVIQNGPYVLEGNLKDIFSTKGLSSKEVILGIQPLPKQVNKSDNYFYYGPAYIPTIALTDLLQNDPRNTWVLGDVSGDLGITKYEGPQIEVSYAFRLTEMYLLEAEALVRSGGSMADAKTLLKTVMQHAGVSDFSAVDNAATSDVLLLEIYKETVRNMLCEDGQDWFALLRLPFATVSSIRPTITSKNQYIFPIPHKEFIKNSAVGEQNPGYDQ
ncbi:MAG: RagB/SusD family nutrient uptake outer membrane protein [Bacteroidetes bacterium]|nr:RagB/SusD family nutrient uptake outer membrane protein [Bacteroidota bacterium]MBS1929650.1 RagB/SusD family nutrient uptake outer membrane protein [Bacteroidota bacterium]